MPSQFQYTGSLLPSSLYLERPTDAKLLALLSAGIYCHVVAPRQIGKSSLRARTARTLREQGICCVSLDLTTFGTPGDADEWYATLADEIARQLGHPSAAELWDKRVGVTPALRMRDFLRHTLEHEPDRRLVLMLDEIESVTVQGFPFDDFLPTLRSFFEARTEDPVFAQLTICLLGVTSPNDLIRDKDRTAFSVSSEIELTDFTRGELDGLRPGFDGQDVDVEALLDTVYGWTAGHPYMTMKICARLVEGPPLRRGDEQANVNRVVHSEFLARPLRDSNLSYASRRFDDPKYVQRGASLPDKIELYARIERGEDVPVIRQSDLQVELLLCGMVKTIEDASGMWLRPRNRIFQTVFDGMWVRARGQRRFLSEAVWAWLDSKKDSSVLLRGRMLDEAVAWSNTVEPSKEEQEFLAASLDQQRIEMEVRRIEIKGQIGQLEAELATSEEASHQQRVRVRLLSRLVIGLVAVFILVGILATNYFGGEISRLDNEISQRMADRYLVENALRATQDELDLQKQQSESAINEFYEVSKLREEALTSLNEKLERERGLLDEVTTAQTSLDSAGKALLACRRERAQMKSALESSNEDRDKYKDERDQYRGDLADRERMLMTRTLELETCTTEKTAGENHFLTCTRALGTVTGQLTTCKNQLGTCHGQLTTCTNQLGTCPGQLTACTNQLGTCPGELTTCKNQLGTCPGQLTTCTNQLGTCPGQLTACTDQLGTCPGQLTTCTKQVGRCPAEPASCTPSQQECIKNNWRNAATRAEFAACVG